MLYGIFDSVSFYYRRMVTMQLRFTLGHDKSICENKYSNNYIQYYDRNQNAIGNLSKFINLFHHLFII